MRWVSIVLALLSTTITFIDSFLVLHPCHKLHYFKTAGWEDEWIDTARDIVREEFDRTYAFMDLDDDEVVSINKVRESPGFIIVVYLLLLNATSPRHRPIYSTICQHYLLLYHQNSGMNLIGTSVLTPSKSRMSVNGGMKGGWDILAFIVWRWIILPFQVCP